MVDKPTLNPTARYCENNTYPLIELIKMTTTALDAIGALCVAQKLSPAEVYNMYELAAHYISVNSGDGVSPSEFEDYLIRDFGTSDYVIATILLDGEIGSIQIAAESEKEEAEILEYLRSIDAILWGKCQQHKTLSLTTVLRSSGNTQS